MEKNPPPSRIPKATSGKSKSKEKSDLGPKGTKAVEAVTVNRKRSRSTPKKSTTEVMSSDDVDHSHPPSAPRAPPKGILSNSQEKQSMSTYGRSHSHGHDHGHLLGSSVLRDMENHRRDDLLQRPHTAIPTLQHQHSSIPAPSASRGWSLRDAGILKDYQQPVIPPLNSTTSRMSSYSTAEELDGLIAKYKPLAQPQEQGQGPTFQVYNSVIDTNHNLNRGASFRKPTVEETFSQRYSQHQQQSEVFVHDRTPSPTKEEQPALGVFGLPLDPNYKTKPVTAGIQIQSIIKAKPNKQHKFPFIEKEGGDLVVHPDQIAFDSRAVSVLVAEVHKIAHLKKSGSLQNSEHLVKEAEDAILRSLNKLYDGRLLDEEPRKAIDHEYLDKEIMSVKYSDSKNATEKLVQDVHHRLRSGRHADTHVFIGDKVYPCNSLPLECMSKFFDDLSRPKETIRRVELPEAEVPSAVFPTLMDWILQTEQGRANVMTKANVVALFSCGKYLDISELTNQCCNFLQEKVETNDRHLMTLWEEVKKRPKCQELMVVISAKAALSFQHIYKEKKFLNLDVDEMIMLLSCDDIVIESELDVFDTAVQWLLHTWETRKAFTNELINTVRFGLLSPLQLTQIAHSPDLAKGATYPHEYPELLGYGAVKTMIDDGLAYSIYYENFKNNPVEVQKWVESTGIKAPRLRTQCSPIGWQKPFTLPADNSKLNLTGEPIERRSSYSLVRDTPHDLLHSPPPPVDLHRNPKRSNLTVSSAEHSDVEGGEADERSHSHARSRSRSRGKKSNKMDAVVESLGNPINAGAIRSLGPSTIDNAGFSARDTTNNLNSGHSHGHGHGRK